jgi:polyisoprenoid-binding protein YceI
MRWFQTAVLCAALAACASTPELSGNPKGEGVVSSAPTDLAATYAPLRAAGARVFTLNPARSEVRIYAFRSGKAARFGHNHVLSAPDFQGFFHLAPDGTAASRFDLAFRLDQLALDDPQHRAALGPAFASAISAEDTASTRNNMLGDNNFQAARFPWVRIHSVQISGDAPKFAARIAVELHGQTREMLAPLTVNGLPEKLVVEGALVLQQSDFGVKPLSVLGGLLSVQDAVIVEFKLSGETP